MEEYINDNNCCPRGRMLFLSGKIGGERLTTRTKLKFQHYRKIAESKGWEVIDPTSSEYQKDLRKTIEMNPEFTKYECCLLQSVVYIARCDAVFFLPDFLSSNGAKAEHAFAKATKKKLYYDKSTPLLRCFTCEELDEPTLPTI